MGLLTTTILVTTAGEESSKPNGKSFSIEFYFSIFYVFVFCSTDAFFVVVVGISRNLTSFLFVF